MCQRVGVSSIWEVAIVYPLLKKLRIIKKCYTVGIVFSFMSEKFSPKKLSREVDETARKSLGRLQAPANLPRVSGPQDASKRMSSDEIAARIAQKRDEINARVAQVKNEPRNDFDRGVLQRLEAEQKRVAQYNRVDKEVGARFQQRAGKKMTAGPAEDKVLFDLDEKPEPRKSRNDIFASDEEKRKNRETAKLVEAKVKKAREARNMKSRDEGVLSYEQYGVPLQTQSKESMKTQEVPMMFDEEDGTGEFGEDNFFEKKTETALPTYGKTKTEKELPAYQEGPKRVKEVARGIVEGLGFNPEEAELMMDKDFAAALMTRQFKGNELGLVASIAKEKANDLKAYFKQMGIGIDKYGEPDLGTWAKVKGLFGGYNKKVMEIKNDPWFKRLALLEMLALDAGDTVSAPRKKSSSFATKAVLGAAAAASMYGAVNKGNKKVESVAPLKPTAEKVERMSSDSRRAETPSEEYIFSEEEADLEDGDDDEDFTMTDKKIQRAGTVERAPQKNTLKEMGRVYKKADIDSEKSKKEGNMASLEKFFVSKEFKNLPKNVRQQMIYALAGSSIVMDTNAFSSALSDLKGALKKMPDPSKKMNEDETLRYYKGLMQMVDRAVNK